MVLKNYKDILMDSETLDIFKNTIIWTFFIAIGHNVIGLFMAYMLVDIPKGEKSFQGTTLLASISFVNRWSRND